MKLGFRNNKFWFYIKNYLGGFLPLSIWQQLGVRLRKVQFTPAHMLRINYYNKLPQSSSLGPDAHTLAEFSRPKKLKTYYFDTLRIGRYFPKQLKIDYWFGDITQIPPHPKLVKTRPIAEPHQNSVLFKLNQIRHFNFIQDPVPFLQKKDMLIGRAMVKQPQRRRFYEMYFDHPLCNLGQINKGTVHDHWVRPKISIGEHLLYKFVLCIEGFDVATNLKWVMSSNSIAVMPEPTYESWFMEGTLVPNVHYIRIAEDYSDVEDVLEYYITHPEACLEIIQNAQEYTQQFQDSKFEREVAYGVMQKYFQQTGQL